MGEDGVWMEIVGRGYEPIKRRESESERLKGSVAWSNLQWRVGAIIYNDVWEETMGGTALPDRPCRLRPMRG